MKQNKFIKTALLLLCLLGSANSVWAWHDISIDLRGGQLGSSLAKYLTIDGSNIYNYADEQPTTYNAYLEANSFNGTQHGYVQLKATIPVEAGNYKLTVGTCQYHNSGYTVTFKDGSNNTLNLVDADGHTVTSLDASGTCDSETSSEHHVSVWYHADADASIQIVFANYTPYFSLEKVESVPAESTQYTVSFSNITEGVDGNVPSDIAVNIGESTTIPTNQTLYKPGYTLTGWNDGSATYAPGDSYTPLNNISLTAVFTANNVALGANTRDKTVIWYFGKSNGAPVYDGSVNVNVKQVAINSSNTIDLGIVMAGGKNDNRNDEWMNNQSKNMVVPVINGAIVKAKVYYADMNASFNGQEIAYNASQHGTVGNVIFTYTYSGEPGTINVNVGNQFLSYIEVTYPGTGNAWDNFTNFELDLRNGNYITSLESTNTTIGFKKSGENIVRTTSDDDDAIGTLTGKYHSNEHGLQNFSMSVAVPGYVKISVGSCAWGGNFTISDANGFSKTINTNIGNCYHSNTTNNKVVAYYNMNEGTTLTLSGGNYVPYIAIESVDEVPATRNVRFFNGETLVESRDIYDGTAVGTLPTAPSVESGKHFRGWYTSCDADGVKAKTSTVITANTDFYAYIMDVNTQNGFVIPDANGQSLLNAIEYCTENAGDDVQKIYIPNGTYDLGTACRTEVGSNIVILGQSREGVLIQNHPTAEGIQATSVLRLTGDNVYLQNLTLRCDVSYSGSAVSGVGVALEINGNRSICNNVELQGNQDTYYSNGSASQVGYFKGGRIEGTVDYICGGGNMWFENTFLYNNERSNKDVILAPSTAAETSYGYVLNNCTVDGASGQEGFSIARPWQGSPAATLINTTFKQLPSAAGYTNMNNGLVIRFHESGSKDADGNAITGHNITACNGASGSHDIYSYDISGYTYANVLGGWDPEATIALYSTTLTSNIANWASFTPAFDCRLSDSDAKAYIITAINENSLTGQTVSVLKAGEGYFIKTPAASQTLKADITYENADAVTGTMLVGCLTATALTNEGNTKYFLGVKGDQAGLFYVGSAGVTIPAGKCYLQSNTTLARNLSLNFDNETTGISEVSTIEENGVKKYVRNGMLIIEKNGVRYNINGIKVNE